ncbi:MAG: poly(3-hydroxybutyrate) depolymerase, partial [Rubritepida sp.]|nr:poly(3-hydroxybutyrate) depolymerase [Rubritepida sp.]
MIYKALQSGQDILSPLRRMSRGMGDVLAPLGHDSPAFAGLRAMRAAFEVFGHAGLGAARPAYDLAPVRVGNRMVEVQEEVVTSTPFASLL